MMFARHRMSGTAEVVSWSKDSINVRWKFDTDDNTAVSSGGYKVRYQAVGSNVVQVSRLLDITASAYDITQLHENTNYDICILRMRQPTTSGDNGRQTSTWSWLTEASACVKGSTSTDSLSVALGSTFGAFLALGLIVALVFVAKWQHSRRAKKRQQLADAEVNGAAAKAELDDDDDELDDVLRVEIAELDTSKSLPYIYVFRASRMLSAENYTFSVLRCTYCPRVGYTPITSTVQYGTVR